MPTSLSDLKKKALEKRLAALHEEYEAATDQLNRTLGEVERRRLQRVIGDLEREIQQVESELDQVGRLDTSTNIQRESQVTTETPSGINIGDIKGGIHGSIIAGRDIAVNSSNSGTFPQKAIKSRPYDWKWIVGIVVAVCSCVAAWIVVVQGDFPTIPVVFFQAQEPTDTPTSIVLSLTNTPASSSFAHTPTASPELANTSTHTSMPTPTTITSQAQQVRWGPVDNKDAGICTADGCTGFIPWESLKAEIEQKLLPQVANVPGGSTAKLRNLSEKPLNWTVEIWNPNGDKIGYVWFGPDPVRNWAFDGLVRVGNTDNVVWDTFQRYSDGSYRKR